MKKKTKNPQPHQSLSDLELLDLFLDKTERADLAKSEERAVLRELRARGVYQDALWESECSCGQLDELDELLHKLRH